MNHGNNEPVGCIGRLWYALLAFGISGILGVAVDLDHILCASANHLPLWPLSNLYDCKIWHDHLAIIGVGGLILTFALGLGLVFYLVHHTLGATADT